MRRQLVGLHGSASCLHQFCGQSHRLRTSRPKSKYGVIQ
jgi:hypothetical protein